jgi:hypothetical protein
MNAGIYDNITIEAYHANRTHLSSTQIRIAKKSLKEFKWYQDGKIVQESKPHFDFGNSFELALLSPMEFEQKVAVIPDHDWCREVLLKNEKIVKPRATADYKSKHDEWLLGREGMYHIPDAGKDSYETIKHMMESCYADKIIQGLIRNTEYQLSLFWTDEETGLGLKTRPDICKRKKNVVVNVKTTEDGSPGAFSKELVKYDYPIQACIEMTGCLRTGLMEQIDNYFWLVCEKNPPYNATIYEFGQEDIKQSMDELHYLLAKIKKAKEENLHPGYSDRADNSYGILTAQIPPYYRMF